MSGWLRRFNRSRAKPCLTTRLLRPQVVFVIAIVASHCISQALEHFHCRVRCGDGASSVHTRCLLLGVSSHLLVLLREHCDLARWIATRKWPARRLGRRHLFHERRRAFRAGSHRLRSYHVCLWWVILRQETLLILVALGSVFLEVEEQIFPLDHAVLERATHSIHGELAHVLV